MTMCGCDAYQTDILGVEYNSGAVDEECMLSGTYLCVDLTYGGSNYNARGTFMW